MILEIKNQETYSRAELLLRSIFGYFYIFFPHAFLLMFFGLWGSLLSFLSFWIILFTGRYPESFFEFQVKLLRWQVRLNARMFNLADGYPSFGINGSDEHTQFDVEYPESLSRGLLLIKVFFGYFYIILPHGFLLMFRYFATIVLSFLAWWVVLFTGKYPESWHEFNVGTLRWGLRLNLYIGFMTDKYPPFSGQPDELPSEPEKLNEENTIENDAE